MNALNIRRSGTLGSWRTGTSMGKVFKKLFNSKFRIDIQCEHSYHFACFQTLPRHSHSTISGLIATFYPTETYLEIRNYFFRFRSEAERGLITLAMDSDGGEINWRTESFFFLLSQPLRKCIKNSRENG